MNVAIIVAAGSGQRFGSEMPKQFLELAGKPVIIHTLQRFEDCAAIDEIVLVLPASEMVAFWQQATTYNLQKLKTVVSGSVTRAASVWNGLQAIKSDEVEVVAVHDGARPLVSPDEISQTIERAQETGAACLVASVTDTIKEIRDGKIVCTIDRAKLRRALTPQCFKIEILRRAFNLARNENTEFTDESMMVERLGIAVSVVEGSPRNIKITLPEDLVLAESLIKQSKV